MFDKRKHVCLKCGEVFHEDIETCRCCGGLCVLGSDDGENVLTLMSPDDTRLRDEVVRARADSRYQDAVASATKLTVDNVDALTVLGYCHLHGEGGLVADPERALNCLGRAVNCGGAEAAFLLFQMFDSGVGCHKKWNIARLMLLLANSRGWPEARQEYAECEKVYRYAIGTPPEPPESPIADIPVSDNPPPENNPVQTQTSQVSSDSSITGQFDVDAEEVVEVDVPTVYRLPETKSSPEYQLKPRAFLLDGELVRETRDWNDFFIAVCEKLNSMDAAKFQTLPATAKMGIAFKLKKNAGKVDFRQTNLGVNRDVCVSKYAGASDLISGHDGKTTIGRRLLELFGVDPGRITFTT